MVPQLGQNTLTNVHEHVNALNNRTEYIKSSPELINRFSRQS